MSILSRFGLGKHRAEEKALRERVTAPRTALDNCRGMAKRWTGVRLEVMGAIAVVFFALGFALGLYLEPILQTGRDLAASLGISRAVPDDDAASAAYRRGDLVTALSLARPLAEAGDARAQSIIGIIYYYGGRRVTQDYQEAVKWFRRAADQGDAGAQFSVGIMFAEGQGVPQNRAEAAKWYRLAADRGHPDAQYNLGLAYVRGEGVSRDNVSAHMWFNLAAARFPASETRKHADAVDNRDRVASKMTPEQVAEAERLAHEWQAH